MRMFVLALASVVAGCASPAAEVVDAPKKVVVAKKPVAKKAVVVAAKPVAKKPAYVMPATIRESSGSDAGGGGSGW